jgi:hypothetical protein
MTELWEDLRAQVTEAARRRTGAAVPWAPPELADFCPCRVIAFDATLSCTGWVHLCVREFPSRISIRDRGTLRVSTDLTGYRATYEKAHRMKQLIQEVVWDQQNPHFPSDVAWEAPAVRGHRLESSLIAGFLVFEAANGLGLAVSANHASSQLAGDPRHGKREIAAAVARYVPESAGRTWNEHQRDALAIALSVSLDKVPEDDDDEIL